MRKLTIFLIICLSISALAPTFIGDLPHFDPQQASLQKINWQTNNTVLNTVNRTFNWTIDYTAGRYHLEVSNSSDFSTVFINLSNISANNARLLAMPGCSYSENDHGVLFSLPWKYNVTYPGTHYYRVRAYATGT